MSMEIEVITDEAVENQVKATAKYCEVVSKYIEFILKKGTNIEQYKVVDAIKLEGLNNELTKAMEELSDTSVMLVAENSYIEAVAKK